MSVFLSNITKIYSDYNPLFNNDFDIYVFENDGYKSSVKNIKDYALLHAKSFTFGEDTLSFDRHNVTKNFMLQSNGAPYKWVDDLVIEWDEDANWTVKRFHEDWMKCFYNRDTDKYISGVKGKYKTFVIVIPNEKGLTATITFDNVIPSNIGSLNMSWNKNPGIVSYSMTYKVGSYSIDYEDPTL